MFRSNLMVMSVLTPALFFTSAILAGADADQLETSKIETPSNINAPSSIKTSKITDLETFQWLHGAKDCKSDTNPRIQIVQANPNSYVLRQNKCVTFEAPFIYVLIGQDKTLVVDTGANQEPEKSPIFDVIAGIAAPHSSLQNSSNSRLLVVHSHSHGDHTKGDSQFADKPNVEVVGTSYKALADQLGLANWPTQNASLELGDRRVTLIPIPGHQEHSIAIYDHQTGWLLTGDTFYPGLIRVRDWGDFKQSIQRLVDFSNDHPVTLILGAHIEQNTAKMKPYKIGATYQPHEPPLSLTVAHLQELNTALQAINKPKNLKFDWFVISPLSRFEKMLSKVLSKNKKERKPSLTNPHSPK